jgi:hypothetical protein
MLFKQKILEQISEGKVKMAFRKWKKPTVKMGGTLLTSVGQLKITSVEIIDYKDIKESEIKKAGYDNRFELDKTLQGRDEGDLYRIKFKLKGEDPRIELRETTQMSQADVDKLTEQLDRLDKASKEGAWTRKILTLISKKPEEHAIYYANIMGMEKEPLKVNVRKLKNLGLTISYAHGYAVSPRGEAYLDAMKHKQV